MATEKYETKTLRYRVNGEAVGLARARTVNVGGHTRTYTPQKSAEEKAAVRALAQQAMDEQHWTMPSGDMPIKVEMMIRCKCPVTKTKWIHTAAAEGLIVPLAKPDIDNVLKLYLDAMNGVVFPDDKQVFQIIVTRQYLGEAELAAGSGPYIDVKVTGYFLNYGDIKTRCAAARGAKKKSAAEAGKK